MQVNNYIRLLWATRGKTQVNVKRDESCANIYFGSESHEWEWRKYVEGEREKQISPWREKRDYI